jgi:hypothetical protein
LLWHTCFRTATRTSPDATSDLLSAESEHVPARRACKLAANDTAEAEVRAGLELAPAADDEERRSSGFRNAPGMRERPTAQVLSVLESRVD